MRACEHASVRVSRVRACGGGGRACRRACGRVFSYPALVGFSLEEMCNWFPETLGLSLSLSLSFMCVFTGGLLVSFMWLPSAAIRSKNQHSIDFPTLGPMVVYVYEPVAILVQAVRAPSPFAPPHPPWRTQDGRPLTSLTITLMIQRIPGCFRSPLNPQGNW